MIRTKFTARMGVNQRRVLSLEEEGRQAAASAGLTRPWDHRPIRERSRSPPSLPRRSPRLHPSESSSSRTARAPRPVATLESLSDSIDALRSSLRDGIMVTDWRVTCMIDYISDMNLSLIRCHTAMNKLAQEVNNMQCHPPGFPCKEVAASLHKNPPPEAETSKRAATRPRTAPHVPWEDLDSTSSDSQDSEEVDDQVTKLMKEIAEPSHSKGKK
ncbi:hypothetical protein RchiOBHm_Chr3g0464581 [Rosa chinensis]|uniref:Uncharacterized protein n=1 Tax=Rosa chinensis TaxID=74649 RepID=A0A2P6R9I0_ROSCH|nr:hypothetical protein RchiOBHm_Chr3g0464581 [Rosa chinensis]